MFVCFCKKLSFQRKICELETVVKTLETNLAEKEASIQILKSSKTLNSGNFEDFFAAVHASSVAAPTSQVSTSINITDQSNILSIPIQQQPPSSTSSLASALGSGPNHRVIHNKSLSHLMATSPMPTASTPTSFGFSQSPVSSYIVTPSSHATTQQQLHGFHIKQLSSPNVGAYQTTNSGIMGGSRLAPNPHLLAGNPNFYPGKGRSLTPSADMLLLRSNTPMDHLKAGRRDSAPGEMFSTSLTNIRGGST